MRPFKKYVEITYLQNIKIFKSQNLFRLNHGGIKEKEEQL